MTKDKKKTQSDRKVHSEASENQQPVAESSPLAEEAEVNEEGYAGQAEGEPAAESMSQVSSLDFPSRKELEDTLTAMEMQVDQYKNQSLRAQAELENVRRRAGREVSNARKFGVEKLIIDLLPVIDGLTRGLESSAPGSAQVASIRDGMQMTLNMLHKIMTKFGVDLIDPKVGEPFNPEYHEAVSMLSDPDAAPDSIYEVVQKGYQLNGRVLRAAMVIVVAKA